MSAIVTAVLKGTLGFLLKKGRQSLAEKLKDGDVTDQQLRSWIVNEFDNVNSKLDAMARSDLGASISFFKEGLVFLNRVIDAEESDGSSVEASAEVESEGKALEASSPETEETTAGENKMISLFRRGIAFLNKVIKKRASGNGSMVTRAEVNALSLAEELRKLNVSSLDESSKEALLDAKKRFDGARWKATEAFNNEALTPSDRILAMAVRLMATILEKVGNPANALAACRSGLEELHLIPFVRGNFGIELSKGVKSKFNTEERRQIILSVCQINRIIYDVALMVGENEKLFLWPCVEIGDENVDPLRDSRVANTLRKLDMGDCSVAWSFGQEGEEEHKRLKSATSIATNALGQFLVVDDSRDDCIKVFDSTGKFLYSFGLPTEDNDSRFDSLTAVATDKDDNIYVLVDGCENRTTTSHMCVFNKQAHFCQKFSVGFKFAAETVKVKDNHLLIPGRFSPGGDSSSMELRDYVVVFKTDGARIGDFSEKTISRNRDITAVDDGNVMVLDSASCVYVFTDITADYDDVDDFDRPLNTSVARYRRKFPVAADARAIAFHWISGYVIVASQTPDGRSQVLLYSKEGKLERSIDLELEKGAEIKAATVTTDGRICITASIYRMETQEQFGKVLVV